MKDEEKPAPRRRELVGRNAFPPFKRNQIRWALHCYRWKHGISWEKYPYEIAHALGIRELGDGLNSRDPRGFVLENQTPTPEKLRLYERFIQKVAPDYARAFSEGSFVSTCADIVARYINLDDVIIAGSREREIASSLEQLIYFSPFPGISGFDHFTAFETELMVLALRRIGDTTHFQVFIFGIGIKDLIAEAEKEHAAGLKDKKRAREQPMTIELQEAIYRRVLSLPFDDVRVANLYAGIAVPHTSGRHYFAMLRNKANEPCFLQFSLCRFSRSETELVWRYTYNTSFLDADLNDPYLMVCLIINGTFNEDMLRPETSLFIMHGEEHESAQDLVSCMGLL